MKKGSQILKLPVVNVDLNEKIGVVTGFVFNPDEKKLAALIIEPTVPMEGLRGIPFGNVASIYDTALMVEDLVEPVNISEDKSLLNVFLNDINLVGSMVVSDEGKTIGIVRDFVIAPEDGRILQINVRIRGGSGERALAREDIVKISAAEIIARTRPGQIIRGASVEAAPKPSPAAKIEELTPLIARKTVSGAAAFAGAASVPERASADTKHLLEDIKKDIRTELFALFETFFADRIKGHFLEMARMVIERINQAQSEEKLQALRDEIIGELSKMPRREDALAERRGELEEQAGSLSLLVEEKIKQGAGNRLDSLAARIEAMEKTIADIRETALNDLKSAIKELGTEVKLGGGDAVEARIKEAVAKISEFTEKVENLDPVTAKTDALREQVGEIRDEMISLREVQDSLRQTWVEIAAGLSGRFDSIESRFRSEESRDADRKQELIDKISGIFASQSKGMPGKDELLSLTTKLETASARLKNLEEQTTGSASEILDKIDDSSRRLATELNAAVTRSATPLIDNLKRSFEKRIEEVKTRTDTFKDEMAGLQDVVRTSTMRVEKKFDERLAEEFDRLSKTVADFSSALPDGKSLSGAIDRAAASIREATDAQFEKLEARSAPMEKNLEAGRAELLESLRKHTDSISDRLNNISGGLSTAADVKALRESIAEVAGATTVKIDKAIGALSVGDELKSLKSDVISSIKETTAELAEKLKPLDLSAEMEELKTAFSQTASENADKIGGRLSEIVSKLDKTVGWLTKKLDALDSAGAANELKSALAQSASELTQKIDRKLSSLASRDELEKFKNEALTPVRGEISALRENFASSTAGNLESLKKDIISAVAPGMKSLRESLDDLSAKLSTRESIEKIKEEIIGNFAPSVEKIGEIFEKTFSDGAAASERLLEEVEKLRKRTSEVEEKTASAVGGLLVPISRLEEKITSKFKELLDAEKAPALSETIQNTLKSELGTLKSELETLKGALQSAGGGQAVERMESEIEDLRNFVKQKVTEMSDISEMAREDTHKQLLEAVDGLFKKNVSDRLEAFVSRHFDAGLSELLEKLSSQPEQAKGMFTRARPKEKAPVKPKLPDRADSAAEKRLEYLIGRTVGKDLLDDDGSPVVAKGTVVDEKLLAAMREKRRLLDLIQCIDFTQ